MTMPARRRTLHLALGGAALILAALAAVGGSASPRAATRLDVLALADDVEREGDHISALELARWIRDAKPDLRVIDLRDADEFDAFRIPGAVRMTLGDVARARWRPGETVVLYAENGTRAAQGWVILRAAGVRDAYFLRGGVHEWAQTIAAPTLPANPSPEQAAVSREIAELSRWFGGVPRAAEAPAGADSLRAALGRIRRRGC